MEAILVIMLLTLIVIFLHSIEFGSSSKIGRHEMKRSILDIEKILNLSDTHIDIELDRMSDEDLTDLYRDLGEKFDTYIRERNTMNNKQALEDF